MSSPETGQRTIAIVGASLAGAKAAQAIRERGSEDRVILIGAEPERPYERPPLSKESLRDGFQGEHGYVHEPDFYERNQIELWTDTTVTGIDPSTGSLRLGDEREFRFDRLLLATGSEPRGLRIPGADLGGVHYLRTRRDCEELRTRLTSGARVAIVGGGWIGSEVAASARQLGCEVCVIDPLELPNERIFGPEVASFYRDVHRGHGVEMRLGQGVERFEGDGTVRRVVTTSGQAYDCDLVVVGVGVIPRTELAQAAQLEIENGLVVDEHLRTSAENVFAAGDVAAAWHPFYGKRIRVEHWANALNQGALAGRAMLGDDVAYDRLPYFFSDQYEVGMEYSGYAEEWDEVVFRGDRADGEFIAFWLKDRRVLAGMNVNVWDVNEQVQAMIRSQQPVDRDALQDLDTPLESLIGEIAAS